MYEWWYKSKYMDITEISIFHKMHNYFTVFLIGQKRIWITTNFNRSMYQCIINIDLKYRLTKTENILPNNPPSKNTNSATATNQFIPFEPILHPIINISFSTERKQQFLTVISFNRSVIQYIDIYRSTLKINKGMGSLFFPKFPIIFLWIYNSGFPYGLISKPYSTDELYWAKCSTESFFIENLLRAMHF